MKLLSNLRVNFIQGYHTGHPIFLFDVYPHSFTFIYVENPRQETGLTIALVLFKYRLSIALYVDRPYTVTSRFTKALRECVHGEKKN